MRSGIVESRGNSIALGIMAGILLFSIPWAWTNAFPRVMLTTMVGAGVTIGVAEALIRVGGQRTAMYGMVFVAVLALVPMFAPCMLSVAAKSAIEGAADRPPRGPSFAQRP